MRARASQRRRYLPRLRRGWKENLNASDFEYGITEKRDKEEFERYRQDEASQRLEQSRRDDLDQERGVWNDTLQARIGQEWSLSKALEEADKVLAAYRERFQ